MVGVKSYPAEGHNTETPWLILNWEEELPARKSLMGIDSPLTGAPSMISYFATVSVSVVVLGPEHNTAAQQHATQ